MCGFAGKWLACQSMDNQIVVFNALNHFKFMRKKVFKGHMVAGYACGLDFSPEMRCNTLSDTFVAVAYSYVLVIIN